MVAPAERRPRASPPRCRSARTSRRAAPPRRRSRRRTPTRRGSRAAGTRPGAARRPRRPRSRPGAGAHPSASVRASSAIRARIAPASPSRSSGISWLPAAVWISTVESPSSLADHAALGLDVLHARHRDQRAPHDEDPALEVDLVLAHLPAPAPPAQLRHQRRAGQQRDAEHRHPDRLPRPGQARRRPCRAPPARRCSVPPTRAATPSAPAARGAGPAPGSRSSLPQYRGPACPPRS